MIKVYSFYKSSSRSTGGANNFLQKLVKHSKTLKDIIFVEKIESADVLFMNGSKKGPLNNSKRITYIEFLVALTKYKKPIVVRAINLKSHSHKHNLIHAYLDFLTVKILNKASHVIFQSSYGRDIFLGAGFKNHNYNIVHNGAEGSFIHRTLGDKKHINFLSISSSRKTKNHSMLSEFSKNQNIKIIHVGRWDSSISPNNVKLMGVLDTIEINRIMEEVDGFIHLAYQDICPNVVFEAITSGLPVIYNNSCSATKEIVGDCGIPINVNHMDQTIEQFITKYDFMVSQIKCKHADYKINKAYNEYVEVFKSVTRESYCSKR